MSAAPATVDRSKVSLAICGVFAGYSPRRAADEATPICDLGLDDIGLIGAVLDIEQDVRVEIPEAAIADFVTVGDVVDFAHARGARA